MIKVQLIIKNNSLTKILHSRMWLTGTSIMAFSEFPVYNVLYRMSHKGPYLNFERIIVKQSLVYFTSISQSIFFFVIKGFNPHL